jgi:hypothetical protein
MRKSIGILTICSGLLLAGVPLVAHHGSGGYDTRNPVTITGTIRAVELINPHSFIFVDAAGKSGAIEQWALEGFPPRVLERSGLTKDNLKPGTTIAVIGFPPRDAYPDGHIGTFSSLEQALAYSPNAIDRLKTHHVLQVGDIRLSNGEVHGYGMGPVFPSQR